MGSVRGPRRQETAIVADKKKKGGIAPALPSRPWVSSAYYWTTVVSVITSVETVPPGAAAAVKSTVWRCISVVVAMHFALIARLRS